VDGVATGTGALTVCASIATTRDEGAVWSSLFLHFPLEIYRTSQEGVDRNKQSKPMRAVRTNCNHRWLGRRSSYVLTPELDNNMPPSGVDVSSVYADDRPWGECGKTLAYRK
jgi:hypothetical protein